MAKAEKTLTIPVRIDLDVNEFYEARSFRQYAKIMQYPDPTRVELNSETADLITDAVNNGLDIWTAYCALCSDYHYDERGREYIEFPEPDKAREILDGLWPDCEETPAQVLSI